MRQHRANVDRLNQMGRDMSASYQGDDTAKVRRITESINQR